MLLRKSAFANSREEASYTLDVSFGKVLTTKTMEKSGESGTSHGTLNKLMADR